jgi:hypothetical protein
MGLACAIGQVDGKFDVQILQKIPPFGILRQALD